MYLKKKKQNKKLSPRDACILSKDSAYVKSKRMHGGHRPSFSLFFMKIFTCIQLN